MHMNKVLLLALAMMMSGQALAEEFFTNLFRFKGVAAMNDKLYKDSCGECHFAYQAGLLPARSWEKMMLPKQLSDHFGEVADLDEGDRVAILNMLVENAADHSLYKRSTKINRSIDANSTPLRITETPYIKKKHKEMTDKYVKLNPKVKSLINCNKCHREIEKGIFDDDTVLIPNFGYWSELE